MNKRLQKDLAETAHLCQSIARGIHIGLTKKDLKLLPSYLDVKTKTAAKKQGLTLKKGAKPIGTCSWRIASSTQFGDLYLGSSFKEEKQK